MTYQIQGANTLDTDVLPSFVLGAGITEEDFKEWRYVLAGAGGLTASQLSFLNEGFTAVAATTTNSLWGNLIGVPAVAIPAGRYGWVQVFGTCTVNALASCLPNVRLNTTATAGALDDDATVGSKTLNGIKLNIANGGATAATSAFLTRPWVGLTL